MTGDDDLDRLRDALRRQAPAPDPAARAETLRRALESFDAHQDRAEALRSSKDRPKGAGFLAGVRAMLDRLTTRAALAATASVAVLAVGAFLVTGPENISMRRPEPISMPSTTRLAAPEEAVAPADLARRSAPASVPADARGAASMNKADAVAGDAADALAAPPVAGMAHAPQATAPRPAPQAFGRAVAPPAVAPSPADRFAAFDPNPLKVTAEDPVSTFSVDVDTASWSWIRASLRMGVLPDPASVRVEEMVNYFPYDYPPPRNDTPFATHVAVFPTPWNPGTRLVRIGLQGQVPETAERPPLNLVFLIDTSGSMAGPDRLGLLKASFGMLLGSLRPEDRVAIVAYAGAAGEVLAPTPASDRATILAALEGVQAGGSTAGGAGLELAYRLAERMGGEGSVNRVVLATDGDFNVGINDPEALKDFVSERRKTGVYLSVLGFGRGNLDDALMQALAQNGNGQAAYIDSAEEARKVLVEQAAGALFPIAGDVKIQVEWNPARVAEYRLIGYETRGLSRVDFADDRVDAGEIGAGHQVTALYEITPVGSPARLTEPLRYGAASVGGGEEAGWLRLRYKRPGEEVSALIEAPIPLRVSEPDGDARFAAAIAGFGQMLTGGRYLGGWGYDQAIALAEGARGADPFGYRAGAVQVMRNAQALAR